MSPRTLACAEIDATHTLESAQNFLREDVSLTTTCILSLARNFNAQPSVAYGYARKQRCLPLYSIDAQFCLNSDKFPPCLVTSDS